MVRSRPCRICRRWFRPHPRVGDRQRVCSAESCQKQRQRDNVAAWKKRHPEYRVAHESRVRELRAAHGEVVDPLEMPPPLSELPWQVAQKQFGVQGTDFIAHLGKLLLFGPKKPIVAQPSEMTAEARRLAEVSPGKAIRVPAGSGP
jgi:hypothetical protein